MPRVLREPQVRSSSQFDKLALELAAELGSDHESGQPLIEEKHNAASDTRSVTVFWDKWEGVPEQARISTILAAYEAAFGAEFAERIAIPAGYTIPEARDLGLLPYSILSGLRRTDPITPERCHAALIAEGASIVENPDAPDLRFPTMEDAIDAVHRLDRRLPGSRDIWIIAQDVRQVGADFDDE